MTARRTDQSRRTRVVELRIADEPDRWRAAGFEVADDHGDGIVDLGGPVLRLIGRTDGRSGITGWTLGVVGGFDRADGDGAGDHLDGLVTDLVPFAQHPDHRVEHPNGITGLDHIVLATHDLDRTTAAIEHLGVPCRRIRPAGDENRPMVQGFFKFGPVTIEVVAPAPGNGPADPDARAAFWGLALDASDLDRLRAHLGPENCSEPRTAVQAGRRIATIRHRPLDLSVRLAALDHPDPANPTDTPPSTTSGTGGIP